MESISNLVHLMYNSDVGAFRTNKTFENRLESIGNGTYPSVTFSVACLSVFLYFEYACYFSVKDGSNG